MATAREFLRRNIIDEQTRFFGMKRAEVIDRVVNSWMNDESNSKHRFDYIETFAPEAERILDMSSGCGSCVFYGLIHGYDMFGIEPEEWKNEFNIMKAKEYGYPEDWFHRFSRGVGENLPYPDNTFDCVTSYQTLEHVQDVSRCIGELFRVTKSGGAVNIIAPDYRSTFEAHYQLPWLPLMPCILAKLYLRLLKKPTVGLDTINYITKPYILGFIKGLKKKNPQWKIRITEVSKSNFMNDAHRFLRISIPGSYKLYTMYTYLRKLFKSEIYMNLFCHIEKCNGPYAG